MKESELYSNISLSIEGKASLDDRVFISHQVVLLADVSSDSGHKSRTEVVAEESDTENEWNVRCVVPGKREEAGESVVLSRRVDPCGSGQAGDGAHTSGQGATCCLRVTGLPKVVAIEKVLILELRAQWNVVVLHFFLF